MYYLYSLTPIYGLLKNYMKYKKMNMITFSRTPLVYLLIDRLLSYFKMKNVVLWTLIIERWFFFTIKIFISWYKQTYIERINKYKIKYNMSYSEIDKFDN